MILFAFSSCLKIVFFLQERLFIFHHVSRSAGNGDRTNLLIISHGFLGKAEPTLIKMDPCASFCDQSAYFWEFFGKFKSRDILFCCT